jgi:alpha-1,2-mannosyltransferase
MPALALLLLGAAMLPLTLVLVVRLRIEVIRLTCRRRTLGFLHPFCNDGGGGERVLWVAIRELLARRVVDPADWRVVVYTGDRVTDDEIRAHALARFGVSIPSEVEFVRLSLRGWIEARRYPVATLVFQALGSALLAAEAAWRVPPDVLVDTTGLAFCFPLLRAVGVRRIAAYVHYPIISSDMLQVVSERRAAHNNAGRLARSSLGTSLKLAYYHVLTTL